MTYLSPFQVGTWNGWTEPTPPPPSFQETYHNLIDAIDWELADVPIEQQTVVIAALWDIDTWSVDMLTAPPTGSRYDGWIECLVDSTSTTAASKRFAGIRQKYWLTT